MLFERRQSFSLYAIAMMLILGASPAFAGHDILFIENEDWVSQDFDLGSRTGFRHIGKPNSGFGIKQQVELNLHEGRNTNLNVPQRVNGTSLIGNYSLLLTYRSSPTLQLYAGLEYGAEKFKATGIPGRSDNALDLHTLYAFWQPESSNYAVGIGRQEVADYRQWLIDEELDGLSWIWRIEDQAATFFAGREQILKKDLTSQRERDTPSVLYARYYRKINNDTQGSVYAAYIDNRADDRQRVAYLGARVLGNYAGHTRYWAEAAIVTGESETKNILGQAIDIGFTRTFKKSRLQPSLTFALAYGSGDDGQGNDSAFRQTGLHGNSGAFNGVVDLDFYGHILNPELNNMMITSIGLGFRPQERWSIDFLLNGYRQVKPSTNLSAGFVRYTPNGVNRSIGKEIDIVLGFRQYENLLFKALIGVFYPGSAATNASGTVRHLHLELQYKF